MTTLVPMSDTDFVAYMGETIPAYAADKVLSGQWAEDQSLEHSRAAFAELLPLGLETPDNYLFNLLDEQGRTVGTLWLTTTEQARTRIAYVYDVRIRPECRRQGHATHALAEAEAWARNLGLAGIGLHVFGHNGAARALYERLGYQPTNISLFKPLQAHSFES